MRVTVRGGELAVALVLLFVSGFALWRSTGMPAGSVALPGPGFVPTALAILLGLTALGLAVRNLTRPSESREPVVFGHRHIAVAVVALCGVAVLLERIGFLPAVGLFLFVLLKTFSSLGWMRSAIAAAAGTLAAALFFGTLLGVALPRGF